MTDPGNLVVGPLVLMGGAYTRVTFWSGFVLTAKPACIPLEVYIDDERAPRRVGLSLGRRWSL